MHAHIDFFNANKYMNQQSFNDRCVLVNEFNKYYFIYLFLGYPKKKNKFI